MRGLWRHYYTGTQGVVFVIDSADRDRLVLASQELATVIGDDQLSVFDIMNPFFIMIFLKIEYSPFSSCKQARSSRRCVH